jgi:recombinational DNA repair protein RecT
MANFKITMPTDDESQIETHYIEDENVLGAIAQFMYIKDIDVEEVKVLTDEEINKLEKESSHPAI